MNNGVVWSPNSVDLNGGTIRNTGSTTVDANIAHLRRTSNANHLVDGIRPTLVTTGDDAPKTSTDGTKIILTFSENVQLQSGAGFSTNFPVTIDGTAATVDSRLARPTVSNSRWIRRTRCPRAKR